MRQHIVSIMIDGEVRSIPSADLPTTALRQLQPIRRFSAYHGQRRHPGLFWSATNGAFVPHESRLEAQHLLLADFDSRVEHIVAQPFRLHCSGDAATTTHVPDFLLLMAEGECEVVNVGMPRRLADPQVALRLNHLDTMCEAIGWRTRVAAGPVPQPQLSNLRFLAAARQPPALVDEIEPEVIATCRRPALWADVEAAVDAAEPVVRAVIAHLIWHRRVTADLGVRLEAGTVLEAA
jgi:hypothetical protein